MNRFAIMRRDGFACKYCGAKASEGVKLHVDHIQPLPVQELFGCL